MNKTITPDIHFQPYINADGMEELHYIDPTFPVELWTANFESLAHNRLATHWHKDFEFALIIRGKALYRFGPESVTLSEGEALFVNSAIPHSTAPFAQDLEMFTIAFPPASFSLPGDMLYEEVVTPVLRNQNGAVILTDQKMIQLLTDIYENARKPSLSCITLTRQIFELWELLADYLQQHGSVQSAIKKPRSREEQQLKQCIAFVRKNWRNNIQIEDLARSASISKNTCYRLFKNYLHVTPVRYINHFRISRAELMLLETNKPVNEIAFSCGFNSPIYFDRLFRKEHAMTPLQYRHTMR